MALRSRLNLSRATYPAYRSWCHQRARATTPAAFDLAQLAAACGGQLAIDGGHTVSAQPTDSPRHEKQDFRAAGGGQAQRRTPAAGGPYSLINGNKSRKPRQHWLSGRFDGQNHHRERTPSGTTTRP